MKIPLTLLAVAGMLAACSDNAPPVKNVSAETVCAGQGLTIGTAEFAACVKRELGYRRMEEFRKEHDERELYRDFERSRRF